MKWIRVWGFGFLFTVLALAINSCGGGGGGADDSTPTAPTATVQPNSPASINGSTAIIISFSTSMNPASLSLGGTLALEDDGGVWSATSSSNDTLTISPASSWNDSNGVAKTLSVDANDSAGTALATLNLSYTVDASLQVPSVSPTNNSSIVDTTPIVITYEETMDTTTLSLGGSLNAQSDGGAWSDATNTNDTLTISPSPSSPQWTLGGGQTLDISANDLVGNSSTVNLSYTVEIDADSDGSPVSLDCNDSDNAIYPGATELCTDAIDNDCDGAVDGADSDCAVCTPDCAGKSCGSDGCGGSCGTCSGGAPLCDSVSSVCVECVTDADCGSDTCVSNVCQVVVDADADGSPASLDCDDGDATVFPGAAEVCDGIDNDCDGSIDEGLTLTTYYLDVDGDNYGDPSNLITNCSQPVGYVTNGSDCDDSSIAVNPTATEVCTDAIDNDCDGNIDSADTDCSVCVVDADCGGGICVNNVCQTDADGDGSAAGLDCDDGDATVYPGATEVCDSKDNDCDGTTDETPTLSSYANSTTSCFDGQEIITCAAGFEDCDGNIANGCESDILSDANNCGSCGQACGDIDGFSCTEEACVDGACLVASANNMLCNDGQFCSGDEICDPSNASADPATGCVAGTAPSCAGDQCNVGSCDETNDNCTLNPVADGTSCDDGNAGTTADQCTSGTCAGTPI